MKFPDSPFCASCRAWLERSSRGSCSTSSGEAYRDSFWIGRCPPPLLCSETSRHLICVGCVQAIVQTTEVNSDGGFRGTSWRGQKRDRRVRGGGQRPILRAPPVQKSARPVDKVAGCPVLCLSLVEEDVPRSYAISPHFTSMRV